MNQYPPLEWASTGAELAVSAIAIIAGLGRANAITAAAVGSLGACPERWALAPGVAERHVEMLIGCNVNTARKRANEHPADATKSTPVGGIPTPDCP